MQTLKVVGSLIIIVLAAGSNSAALAKTISAEQFAHIQTQYRELSLVDAINDPAAYIDRNSETSESYIYLSSLILNKLVLIKEPTQIQREWLQEQALSQLTLSVPSFEHTNHNIVVTHIAHMASMVEMHWQAYDMVNAFKQRWELGIWSWSQYFREGDKVPQMAMAFWLDEMSDSGAQLFVDSYLNEGLKYDVDSNRQLSLLINKTQSPALYKALWQRKSDPYSHRALRSLIEQGEHVDQIINAAQNTSLSSQAMFSLMKSHSDRLEVQAFVRDAIENKSLSSMTVATLGLLNDGRFKSELLTYYQQQPSTDFTRQVVKQLAGESK